MERLEDPRTILMLALIPGGERGVAGRDLDDVVGKDVEKGTAEPRSGDGAE
jgi:hypothetical protein